MMWALPLGLIVNSLIAAYVPRQYLVPYYVYCFLSGWFLAGLAT